MLRSLEVSAIPGQSVAVGPQQAASARRPSRKIVVTKNTLRVGADLAVTLDKTDTTLNQGFHQDSWGKKKRRREAGATDRYLYCRGGDTVQMGLHSTAQQLLRRVHVEGNGWMSRTTDESGLLKVPNSSDTCTVGSSNIKKVF